MEAVTDWQGAGIDTIIWDGAPGHRAQEVQQLSPTLICQPPYAPELNPAERVFEAVRQEVEGIIYETLEAKRDAVDRFLHKLAAAPQRIQSLTGWKWIRDAVASLFIPDTR